MIGQIIRILALLVIVLFIYWLYHSFLLRNESLLFYIVFVLILFLPLIQSLLLQWMEVRADHLGAIWLDNGNDQMADGLTALAVKQDELTYKAERYNLSNEEQNSSIERDSWFFRFLEFQFMIHPPMYWRIQSLKETGTEWNMKKYESGGKSVFTNRFLIKRIKWKACESFLSFEMLIKLNDTNVTPIRENVANFHIESAFECRLLYFYGYPLIIIFLSSPFPNAGKIVMEDENQFGPLAVRVRNRRVFVNLLFCRFDHII